MVRPRPTSPATSAEGRLLAYTLLDRAGADNVAIAEGGPLEVSAVDLYHKTSPKSADALSALQVVELRPTSQAGSVEGGRQVARTHTLLGGAGAEGAAEVVAAGAAAGDGATASALAQRRRSSLRTSARRSTLERQQRCHLSPATTVTRCGHSSHPAAAAALKYPQAMQLSCCFSQWQELGKHLIILGPPGISYPDTSILAKDKYTIIFSLG